MRRALFLVTPHIGGTFTVFLSLRQALQDLDIDLQWLGYSSHPENSAAAAPLARHLSTGHWVDARGLDSRALGERLLERAVRLAPEWVFINVLTGPAEMSLAAFLPAHIRRVMIVHNITPGTYDGARAVGPYVHASVGVSPRIRDELVRKLRFPSERTFFVPNAVDVGPFLAAEREPRAAALRLLSLGRVIDVDKGVFWLPEILEGLVDLPVHLTVAGDGPDLPELRRRCASLESAGRVTFAGRVSYEHVPALAAAHDVLIMPSRFEGFGYTLIEAMGAGCVPVASRIAGVTTFVIQEDFTGLTFPIGNVRAAAAAVRRLARNEALRQAFGDEGRRDVTARFSIATMRAGYARVLNAVSGHAVLSTPPLNPPFRLLPFGGGWRKWIPKRLKQRLREIAYRR